MQDSCTPSTCTPPESSQNSPVLPALAYDLLVAKLSSMSCACDPSPMYLSRVPHYCHRAGYGISCSVSRTLGAVKFRSTSSAIHLNHCGEARGPEIKQIIKKSKFGMLTLPLLSSANFSLRRCGLPAATFPDTHFPSTWWFPRKQRNVRLRFIGDMVLCTSLFCCHFQTCNRADNGFLRHIVEPTTASSDTAYSSRFR